MILPIFVNLQLLDPPYDPDVTIQPISLWSDIIEEFLVQRRISKFQGSILKNSKINRKLKDMYGDTGAVNCGSSNESGIERID
ncbi:unnamed protein product [Rhizophagus irregularis]|uniref:Uncharacterized protein n=1 Tax=Rhizophagus irregularis TaxID=588596 RepID=A0A2I1GY02_9GLOM|nr:hypothetical protein RhiirA4_468597 [Rhizophagus irregularis]CAB4422715.1 unnamed protein product [Rhizophagus irregularis]